MIYVDELVTYDPQQVIEPAARRCGTQWCHLWCDPGEEEALHAFAARIGLRRAWYQHKGKRVPHYDLTPGRRLKAVRAGARIIRLRQYFQWQLAYWKGVRAFAGSGLPTPAPVADAVGASITLCPYTGVTPEDCTLALMWARGFLAAGEGRAPAPGTLIACLPAYGTTVDQAAPA